MTSQAMILLVIYHEIRPKFKLEINDIFVFPDKEITSDRDFRKKI